MSINSKSMFGKHFLLLTMIALSLIPLLDLFRPGLPLTHDGQDHIARIANFYQNLKEGNIVPRWAGNLNWGYGHPILMFLYPLPSYIASVFHFFGFTLGNSTKLVFGVAYVLSGITMYLWVNDFLGKRAAFVSSLLYLFVPYRFVDLYVRGAIGEHVAFIFPPLICYFLLVLSKRHSYWLLVGGSLSFAALVLSHNAIALMFLPVIFFYGIYLLWQSNQRGSLLLKFGMVGVLGIMLPAFFWMPAFFEGKYTLRDIVTTGEYVSRFVPFTSLIWGTWSYGGTGQFTTQVGIVQWCVVLLGVFAMVSLKRIKNRLWILGVGSLLIFFAALFLMLAPSKPIWETITTLQKFQFPWRFLSVIVFIAAFLGGVVFYTFLKGRQMLLILSLAVGLLWFNKGYWHAKDFLQQREEFFTGIYHGTTDTGESSPIWSVRFMEKEPAAHIEVIDYGNAKIREIKRTSTYHSYQIESDKSVRIRENTLYFPGWEVFVDGQKQDIEFQDPANRGLITFFVDKGNHEIVVSFVETKIRLFANFLSITGFVLLILLMFSWRRLGFEK